MAITHSYVDYGAGSDATGDGTIGTPWKTLQKAFDTCVRNTTDGNQVNLKAGTPHVNAAALDLTTFLVGGALAAAAPLILRGYTSAANDGGIGEIDCGGATMWAATTYDYVILADLKLHNFGDNHGIVLDQNCRAINCEIYSGASSPAAKYLISWNYSGYVERCYLHDTGTGGGIANVQYVIGNYIVLDSNATGRGIIASVASIRNIVLCQNVAAIGIYGSCILTSDNIVYNTAAGTAQGIGHTTASINYEIYNNIVVGFSGALGAAIRYSDIGVIGHNAFYNNTAPYAGTDQKFIDLTANDVALAADPFTDAANGDFSLTAAAKTALAGKGWPTSYLGAHANTVSNLNIGPIQLAASAGGGGMLKAEKRGGKQ